MSFVRWWMNGASFDTDCVWFLGHNSKAVHHAYSKHAEVTVPSLDDWEKDWQENPQRSAQPKLLPVDFRLQVAANAQSN